MCIRSRNKIKVQDKQIIREGGDDKQVIIPCVRVKVG